MYAYVVFHEVYTLCSMKCIRYIGMYAYVVFHEVYTLCSMKCIRYIGMYAYVVLHLGPTEGGQLLGQCNHHTPH